MYPIPDTLIETVRGQTDLVHVVSRHLTLRKAGRNFVGLCPFHIEKTPSFTVNPEKQFFHCFGCAAGGDVFHFVSTIEQITFPEAVRRLAGEAGIALPDPETAAKGSGDSEAEALYRVNEEAARLFHETLLTRKEAGPARHYLAQRGITQETLKTFCVGFAAPRGERLASRLRRPTALLEKAGLIRSGSPYETFQNRIMLPIKTVYGRIVGFGGRALDEHGPKYLNTPETPIFSKGKQLYGLDLARGQKSLIIVEGYFDAMSLHQRGISNAVATLGTAVTPEHLHLMQRYLEKVFLVFDPDAAGQAALLRAAPLFMERPMAAYVISLPVGCDPDLFIRQHGQAAFQDEIQQAKPLMDVVIARAASASGPSMAEKTKALDALFLLIQKITHKVEQGHYLKKIAESFGMEEQDLRADFKARLGPSPRGTSLKTSPRNVPATSSHQFGQIPEDEKTLLALLIQDRLDPSELKDLRLSDFVTPALANLAAVFWKGSETSWFKPSDPVKALADPERKLFTELAVLDIPHENQDKIKIDCIRSVQTKRLKRDSLALQKELKTAERARDRLRTEALQHAFFNIKKELSQKIAS